MWAYVFGRVPGVRAILVIALWLCCSASTGSSSFLGIVHRVVVCVNSYLCGSLYPRVIWTGVVWSGLVVVWTGVGFLCGVVVMVGLV